MGACYLLVVLTPLLGGPWRDMRRPAVVRQHEPEPTSERQRETLP
ncbi:hypothetical protein [Micromonospora sp. CNB394]|nr:hypothetical protein [Micromonospora sp. CNB394]